MPMQVRQIISGVLWLFRIAAIAEVVLGSVGLLWFSKYYFSEKHALDTAIAVVPLVGLLVGALTPDRILVGRRGFLTTIGVLLFAAACVAIQMHGDLILINGPDYPAFRSRFLGLGLIVVFVGRAVYCNSRKA